MDGFESRTGGRGPLSVRALGDLNYTGQYTHCLPNVLVAEKRVFGACCKVSVTSAGADCVSILLRPRDGPFFGRKAQGTGRDGAVGRGDSPRRRGKESGTAACQPEHYGRPEIPSVPSAESTFGAEAEPKVIREQIKDLAETGARGRQARGARAGAQRGPRVSSHRRGIHLSTREVPAPRQQVI